MLSTWSESSVFFFIIDTRRDERKSFPRNESDVLHVKMEKGWEKASKKAPPVHMVFDCTKSLSFLCHRDVSLCYQQR